MGSASGERFSKFDFGNKPAVLPGLPGKAAASGTGKKASKPDKHGLLKQVRLSRALLDGWSWQNTEATCDASFPLPCPFATAIISWKLGRPSWPS